MLLVKNRPDPDQRKCLIDQDPGSPKVIDSSGSGHGGEGVFTDVYVYLLTLSKTNCTVCGHFKELIITCSMMGMTVSRSLSDILLDTESFINILSISVTPRAYIWDSRLEQAIRPGEIVMMLLTPITGTKRYEVPN
jgi:hypothetical protein